MLDGARRRGGRDRRLDQRDPRAGARSSSFFVVGRPQLADGDLLLRRHPADVLPGLAPRVHHQPDRHPDRRRHPAPAARCVATVIVYTRSCVGWSVLDPRHRARRWRPRSAQFVASIPDIRANLPTIVAPLQAGSTRSGSARSTSRPRPWRSSPTSTRSPPRSSRRSSRSRSPASARRDDAHRLHPVDLHGHRPRPDHGVPLPPRPARVRGGGPAAPDVASRARSVASSAARRSWASSTSRSRWSRASLFGPAAGGADGVGGRAAHGDPVLRAVRVVGAAGHRGALSPSPRRSLPDARRHGRRLVRRDERPPAADHAGRGRHPPDRRPRFGAHRLARSRASPGAIFGIPIAAVVSAFFFHFLHRTAGDRTVAGRARRKRRRANARAGRSGCRASRRPARPRDVPEP